MIGFIIYLVNFIRLLCWKRTKRLNNYSPEAKFTEIASSGVVANQTDWDLSTPNLVRNESITIVASNTFDKSAININLKWRPNLPLTTLLSRMTLELGGQVYEYEDVTTYRPPSSRIPCYGTNKSCLKLIVLHPYSRYRILFRGYMKRRGENTTNELVFVKLNILALTTSRVYDFKEQFDADLVAHQISTKRPSNFSLEQALNGLILHDRHEHGLRLIGEYSMKEGEIIKRDVLHLWGFHIRHFIDESTKKFRSKRILGHFSNGRFFHIGVCENVDNNFDLAKQFSVGYTLFHIATAIHPLVRSGGTQINWEKVNSHTLDVNFDIREDNLQFKVKGKKREHLSEFLDATLNDKEGWAIILINDSLDMAGEVQAIEASHRSYQQASERGEVVDASLFEETDFPSKPLTVGIEESLCLQPSLVGAKASSLAQLKAYKNSKIQYEVPDALMLTRFAYEAVKEANLSLQVEIKSLEALVGRGALEDLPISCEKLQRKLEQEIEMPTRLRKELEVRMKSNFNIADIKTLDGRSFAVRSSSWGEDEDDMSAAGQLSTILNVSGFEQLVEAVMKCFASKFGQTNIEYKRQHGLPLDMPMAVVVQEMVSCDKAGVLFTCDPANGDPATTLITANYGLGESVVSGQTDPDTIKLRISEQHAGDPIKFVIEEVKIGEKKVIAGAFDTELYDRQKCSLDEDEIFKLAECARKLEEYFQSERDIEWGFKGKQLYLFQSRPVTGLDAYTEFELIHEADQLSRAELEFTSRANIGEVMAFACSPFQLTFGMKLWAILAARFFPLLGTVSRNDYTLHYAADFVTCSYHIFFSLRSKALFNFACTDGKRSAISRAMEVGIFGHEVDDPELIREATDMSMDKRIPFQNLRFEWHTIGYRLFLFKENKKMKNSLARLRRDVHSLRFVKRDAKNSMEALLHQLKTVCDMCDGPFCNHLICTMASSNANFALIQLLSKYIQDPVQLFSAFSKFLATSPNVLSAEIPRRIDKMAKLVSKRGADTLKAFVEMTPKEGLKYVSSDLTSELAKEFDAFMAKFGHRCYNEFELSQTSWRDKPETIVELLQTNSRKYLNSEPKEDEKETQTLDEIIQSLNVQFSFLDRLNLRYFVAPRCQSYVSGREQTKDLAIEHMDIVRDASRLLAREMRQQNRIPDEELFYFLFFNEVEALVEEPQPSFVMQAIRRRRLAQKLFAKAWQFDEIIRGYDFSPKHLKPSREIDEKLANAPRLIGTTASSGKVQGRVCLVNNIDELNKVREGDILLAYSTDIAFSPIFPLVSGVITEVGGLISHGAVVAREYGLPSVIGILDITKILQDGEEIILDADSGAIIRLNFDQHAVN